MEDILIEGAKIVGSAITGGGLLKLYDTWVKSRDSQQAYFDKQNRDLIERILDREKAIETINANLFKEQAILKQEQFAALSEIRQLKDKIAILKKGAL